MNRWVRAGLAVAVGFVATSAAIAAVEAQTERPPPAEKTELGGVNTFTYCRGEYGEQASAVIVGRNAWSWRCAFTENNLFREVGIDFDLACREQHGAHDAYAESWDTTNPYSWSCFVGE